MGHAFYFFPHCVICDEIPDTVNSTLLGAGYFCISICVLELCTGTQVSHLQKIKPFRSCSQKLLGNTKVLANLELITPL